MKILSNFIIVMLLIGSFEACVHTQASMDETVVYLRVEENNGFCNVDALKVFLRHGKVETTSPCNYKITFYEANGGQDIFLGKVIKNQNPNETNKMKISMNSVLIRELSHKELIKLDYVSRDSIKTYILNIR